MSNEFEYLSHDEDGDEEDIDLMEDTSDGEAMSDEEEIGNGNPQGQGQSQSQIQKDKAHRRQLPNVRENEARIG